MPDYKYFAFLDCCSDFCSSEKQRGQQMDLLILKYGSQIYKHSDTFGISPLEYAVMNLQGDTTASILRHAASEAENLRRRVALAAAAANMKQQSDFASYYPNDVMTGTNVMSSAIRSAGDTRAGTSGIKDLGEMFQEQGIPDSAGVGRGRSSIQRQPPPIVPLFPSIRQQQQQQLPHQQQQHGINEGDVMECKWNALHRIKSLQLFTEAIVNTTYIGLSSASVLNIAEYLTNSPMDSLKRIGQAVYKFIEQQRNHQQNTNDDDGDDDKENGSEQSLSELSSSSSRSPFPPAISLKRSASTESSSSAAAAFTTSSRLLNKKRLKMNREGEKTVGGMSIASMVI